MTNVYNTELFLSANLGEFKGNKMLLTTFLKYFFVNIRFTVIMLPHVAKKKGDAKITIINHNMHRLLYYD